MSLRNFVFEAKQKAIFESRRIVGAPRAMPDFIVIGAQKSGTSSIFIYLRQHPRIIAPVFKELYYFDRHYDRGLAWYGCNFPAKSTVARLNDQRGAPHLTFEATATYIFDKDVPARIARDIETRKFIALLRNPADRAISAYWHARRLGRETRSLADALKADLDRYEAETLFEAGNGPKPPKAPPGPTYLRRGIYHEAITNWRRHFAAEEMLIIQSEVMFAHPGAVMARVFEFLDLPPVNDIDVEPQNVGAYDDTDRDTRRWLSEFYAPHTEKLSQISGASFSW
jgi:hypothetical protein